MCWIASKTSTWYKLFKRQKKKVDQTNLNQEGVFQHWNVSFFVCYDFSNVMFCLVWFVQKIQGRDLRLPKTIEYTLPCCFELFQFPPVTNWNYSLTHMHMELWHAVANEHGNLRIKLLHCLPAINVFLYLVNENNETKQCSIKGFFFMYGISLSLLFLRVEEIEAKRSR